MRESKTLKLTTRVITALLGVIFFTAALLADDVTPTAQPAVKKIHKIKKSKSTASAVAPVAVTQTAAPESVTPAAAPASVTPSAAQSVSVSAIVIAQPSVQVATALTFEDCYKIASDKNRDFKIANLDKTISEAELSKAVASFGPSITLSGSYEPENVQAPLVIPYGSAEYGMFAGLYQSAGITPTAGAPLSLSLFPSYYYMSRVTLTQPLFTFGKTYYGFKMADEAYKIAMINFKKANDKLNLDVMNAFYGALIAQEMANTLEETMKSNEEYLRITRTKYENGQASNFDVLQAQVQYANSIPDFQRAADGAKLSLESLKNTLGIPLDQQIQLSGTPEYKKLQFTYEELKKKFEENNSDKQITEHAANLAGYQKNLQEAMFLPNIALTANYNYTSSDPAFHHEAWDWQSSWDVEIGMQWSLFDSFKNVASMKEANANDEKAKLNRENADNMLTIELDSLYTSLTQNGQIIEAADDLIKTAEEGYRIAKESYKNGLIQSVDLLNAETQMLRAKMNYLNALFNYITTAQKLKDFVN
jgi:outer membrane protein TolC